MGTARLRKRQPCQPWATLITCLPPPTSTATESWICSLMTTTRAPQFSLGMETRPSRSSRRPASRPRLAVADLNGDGIPDLVVGGTTASDEDGNAVVIWALEMALFNRQDHPSLTHDQACGPAVVADFNGDGIPDIAVSGAFYSPVSVFLGKGDGTFTPVSGATNPSINEPGAIAVADFNHDGKVDLAITNWNSYPSNSRIPTSLFCWAMATALSRQFPETRSSPIHGRLLPPTLMVMATPDLAVGTSSGLSVLLTEPSQTATATVTGVAPTGPAPHVDASYPGDTNYSSSTSATTALSVQWPRRLCHQVPQPILPGKP